MSLESFIGFDSGEGMSEAAFEAFKEKMKKASAQIAAIKKEEGKQKKKEEELLKILANFIKNSHKKDLTLLISRVLEQNIPANFILAIILLGNEEIQQQAGKFLMLGVGGQDEKALTFFGEEDASIPLKMKIEIDEWMKTLLFQANERPQKLLKNAYKIEIIEDQEKKSVKKAIINLTAFVIREFFEKNNQHQDFVNLKNFAVFIIKGILSKTNETLKNRRFLKS